MCSKFPHPPLSDGDLDPKGRPYAESVEHFLTERHCILEYDASCKRVEGIMVKLTLITAVAQFITMTVNAIDVWADAASWFNRVVLGGIADGLDRVILSAFVLSACATMFTFFMTYNIPGYDPGRTPRISRWRHTDDTWEEHCQQVRAEERLQAIERELGIARQ